MKDAYKIGITVALTNLIGSELTRIAREFGIADKSAAGFAIEQLNAAEPTIAPGTRASTPV